MVRSVTLLKHDFRPIVHVCPHCEAGTLEREERVDAPSSESKTIWICSHAPVCLYQAEDHSGTPLGRFNCGHCARPLKLVRTRLRSMWRCTGWFAKPVDCRATYADRHGVPGEGRLPGRDNAEANSLLQNPVIAK